MLQMPDSLVGLFDIADRVRTLEPKLAHWAGSGPSGLVGEWARAVQSIPPQEPLRQDPHLIGGIRDGEFVKPPTAGYKTFNPVWCALWHTYWNDAQAESAVYGELQAHMLAAWVRLVDDQDKPVPERWDQAGRLLRKVHQRSAGWFILDVVDVVDDVQGLAHRLEEYKEASRGPGDEDPVKIRWEAGSFAQVLSDAHGLGLKLFKERSGGGGGPRPGPANRMLDSMTSDHSGFWRCIDFEMQVAGWGTDRYAAHSYTTSLLNGNDLDARGQDPGEYEVTEVAELPTSWVSGNESPDLEVGSLPPLATLMAAARAKSRRIAMEAQSLRVEPDRIRLGEIGAVLEVLANVFTNGPATDEIKPAEKRLVQNTALLASVSLISGVEAERACSLFLIRGVSDLPANYPVAFNPEFGMWIRPYRAPDRHALQGRYREHPLDTWPRVVFEDAWGVGRWLSKGLPRSGTGRRGGVFEHRYKTYLGRWDSWIAPLLRRRGVRARWTKLENIAGIIPSWLAWQEEGDHLPLRLLFGVQDPRSASQRYYTAWQRADLARRYHDHLGHLWGKLVAQRRWTRYEGLFEYQERKVTIDESWVGNDRTPAADSVRDLVRTLRRRVRKFQRSSKDPAVVHNWIAAYTGLGLAMATGARAVRTPIPDLHALHRRTGTICLQEKDRIDANHARLVVLPQVVIDQIDIYLRHVEALFIEHPELRERMRVPATKHRDRSAYNAASYLLYLPSTLFFFEASEKRELQPTEFTGRTLKHWCDLVRPGNWPVDNAGRHLLRGYLVEQRCPATLINTHLGHWHYGEAPWSGPSAMDPYHYRHEIRPYLERLMDKLDYRPVK